MALQQQAGIEHLGSTSPSYSPPPPSENNPVADIRNHPHAYHLGSSRIPPSSPTAEVKKFPIRRYFYVSLIHIQTTLLTQLLHHVLHHPGGPHHHHSSFTSGGNQDTLSKHRQGQIPPPPPPLHTYPMNFGASPYVGASSQKYPERSGTSQVRLFRKICHSLFGL